MTARKRPGTTPSQPARAKTAPKTAPKAAPKPAAKPGPKAGGKPASAKPAGKSSAKPAAQAPPNPVEPKAPPEKIPPRAKLVPKLHKALRAHYKPVPASPARPILDQVLFACCLENAPADVAERAYDRLRTLYPDCNEIRVTTVAELAESLQELPDPPRAALSLRRALQGVFESTYTFSLEHARKHSLAHGIKVLEGLHGLPQFVVQHVAASALGGHLIPLDKGAIAALWLCGLITRAEYDSGKVPGLERTIGKKAGAEFSSLLHQFGVDVLANPQRATVRKIAAAVNAGAKDRFPKRGESLPEPVPPPVTLREGQKAADAARAAEELRPAGPQAAARPAGKTPLPPPGSGPKKPADGKGKSGPKPFVVKPLSIKPPAEPAPPEPPKKMPAAAAKPAPTKVGSAKQSAQLSKRKPR